MRREFMLVVVLAACGTPATPPMPDAGDGDAATCPPPIVEPYPSGRPRIEYSDAYVAPTLPSWWVDYQADRVLNQRAIELGCCRFDGAADAWPSDCGRLEQWWPHVYAVWAVTSCEDLSALQPQLHACEAP